MYAMMATAKSAEGVLDQAIVTVVTCNHLHYARALATSVREYNKALPIFVCLVDRPPIVLDDSGLGIQYIFADTLVVPEWRRFAFQYSGFELSCALKPFVLEHMASLGVRKIVYLDADIQVYGQLDVVIEMLNHYDILLTPHLTEPLPHQEQIPSYPFIRLYGSYNAGFVAIRVTESSLRFVQWWKEICRQHCILRLGDGVCHDQSWLDFVPGLFDGVRIVRDPGWNVAYWNLSGRVLRQDGLGRWLANGHPLIFFHFSGFDPEYPEVLTRYLHQTAAHKGACISELLREYGTRLNTGGRSVCESWGYEFDTLNNGTRILPAWRDAIRTCQSLSVSIHDPFDATTNQGLIQLLNAISFPSNLANGTVLQDIKSLLKQLCPPVLLSAKRRIMCGRGASDIRKVEL